MTQNFCTVLLLIEKLSNRIKNTQREKQERQICCSWRQSLCVKLFSKTKVTFVLLGIIIKWVNCGISSLWWLILLYFMQVFTFALSCQFSTFDKINFNVLAVPLLCSSCDCNWKPGCPMIQWLSVPAICMLMSHLRHIWRCSREQNLVGLGWSRQMIHT